MSKYSFISWITLLSTFLYYLLSSGFFFQHFHAFSITHHLQYEFIDVKINFLFLALYSIFPLQLILIESMLRVCKILIWRRCMSQFFKVIFKMIFFLERIKNEKQKLYGYLNVFFTIGNKSDFLEHILKKKWLNIIIFFLHKCQYCVSFGGILVVRYKTRQQLFEQHRRTHTPFWFYAPGQSPRNRANIEQRSCIWINI